ELFMLARGDIYHVITPEKRYILRIYHAALHTQRMILSEVELLDYLRQHGLSVAFPLRRLDGEWLLTLQASEGTRYGVLYTFAEGQKISADTPLEAIVRYGELVARVHEVADTIPFTLDRPPIMFASLVDDGLDRLAQLRPHLKTETAYLREVADIIRPK